MTDWDEFEVLGGLCGYLLQQGGAALTTLGMASTTPLVWTSRALPFRAAHLSVSPGLGRGGRGGAVGAWARRGSEIRELWWPARWAASSSITCTR